jgi:hypothetical protein
MKTFNVQCQQYNVYLHRNPNLNLQRMIKQHNQTNVYLGAYIEILI